MVLLPAWGVYGVAAAVSVSYASTLLVMLGYSRTLGIGLTMLLVPTFSDISYGWSFVHWSLTRRAERRGQQGER